MQPSTQPRLFVVSGLPGSGKSTTSKELASRFERAAHVEADQLQSLITSGAVFPDLNGINTEARQQLDLRLANACLLARSFLQAGFNVVIDEIVIGPAIEDLRQHLNDIRFEFIMLVPDFDHVKQRWIDMQSPFAESWDWIDDEIRNHTERIGHWIDTTNLDPQQTVDLILEREN